MGSGRAAKGGEALKRAKTGRNITGAGRSYKDWTNRITSHSSSPIHTDSSNIFHHDIPRNHPRIPTSPPPLPPRNPLLEARPLHAPRPPSSILPQRRCRRLLRAKDLQHPRVPQVRTKREWIRTQDIKEPVVSMVGSS